MLVDNLSDILVFSEIVKLGSLSAAGKKLGLSSAVISKRLQRLESKLDTALITRSTRKLSVTEEGQKYFEHCGCILNAVEEAEAEILYRNKVPKGTLKLSVPAYFGRLYIAPLIPDFLEKYPEIELSLDFSDHFVDIINSGYDVVIRIGDLKDSNLIAKKLAIDQRVLVAAPKYINAHGIPNLPSELNKHNVLLFMHESSQAVWSFFDVQGKEHNVKVSGNFATNNCEALMKATKDGLGIALRPMWDVWRSIQSKQLIVLMPDYTAAKFNIQAVYPSRDHLPHRVRVFIDFFKQHLDDHKEWRY
jgi:DNA-binding transcriptional LysR family regulator